MQRKKKVLIYGAAHVCRETVRCLESLGRKFVCEETDNRDMLHEYLMAARPCLVVVAKSGAAGMEGVILAKKLRPDTPLFWFSDDKDFSVQSHRLECEYFSQMPVTPEKLESAFRRCAHVGIAFPGKEEITALWGINHG